MKKSSKTYTVIDWEELRNIRFHGDYYVETNPMKEKKTPKPYLNRFVDYILHKRLWRKRILWLTKINSRITWNSP